MLGGNGRRSCWGKRNSCCFLRRKKSETHRADVSMCFLGAFLARFFFLRFLSSFVSLPDGRRRCCWWTSHVRGAMQFLALLTCSEKLLHFFVLFEHVQGSRLPKCTSREINLRSLESCTDRAWTVTIGGDQRGLDFLAGRITTRFLRFYCCIARATHCNKHPSRNGWQQIV